MRIAVDTCYKRAEAGASVPKIMQCYYLQRSSGELDAEWARLTGIGVIEQSLTKESSIARAEVALSKLGKEGPLRRALISLWEVRGGEY